MRLEVYISGLLYRYQCVTVPGFGAFLTESRSARVDETTNTFYPPQKVILFNFHLKNNDGLLANHLAKSENLSHDAAVRLIESEVSRWKSSLQSNESIKLKNVGRLYLNAENNLVFENTETPNYLTDSFGLASLISPQIKREVLAIVEKETAGKFEEKETISIVPESRNSYKWVRYAAVAVLGFGAAGFFGNQWYEQKLASDRLMVEKAVQEKVEQKIQEATFFVKNPLPAVTLTVIEENLNYHIVAGAFKDEKNAEKALKELITLGYNAKKIAPNKYGLHSVLYGSYATLEKAQEAKITIQQNHNKDAWILVQELQ